MCELQVIIEHGTLSEGVLSVVEGDTLSGGVPAWSIATSCPMNGRSVVERDTLSEGVRSVVERDTLSEGVRSIVERDTLSEDVPI